MKIKKGCCLIGIATLFFLKNSYTFILFRIFRMSNLVIYRICQHNSIILNVATISDHVCILYPLKGRDHLGYSATIYIRVHTRIFQC